MSYEIQHPVWMVGFMVLTAITFCLFGFIIGLWADSFQKLQVIPLLVITPLTFLGGAFYSINMLPPFWQTVSLFNPVVYLISGLRWAFYGQADVHIARQHRHDPGLHGRLSDRGLVGVQDGPQDPALNAGAAINAHRPAPPPPARARPATAPLQTRGGA